MVQNPNDSNDGSIIGLVEEVQIITEHETKTALQARIDTGAIKSSMDINLAKALKLGPIIKEKIIKQSSGSELRPIIKAEILLQGKRLKGMFTLSDRSNMTYRMLIGQNLLKKGKFLIDPNKK